MPFKKGYTPYNKGKKSSDKTKELISKNHSRHMLGKKHSKETLEKISKARKGKNLGHKFYGDEKSWFQKGHPKLGGFVKGDKHKPETIERIRIKKKGSRCPNPGSKSNLWKGGITPIMRYLRTYSKYLQWRIDVFKRDNYTCVFCGDRNYEGRGKTLVLNADHIRPLYLILADNEITDIANALKCKELWDIDNGRTLCRPCHQTTKTWGRPRISTN